MRRAGSPPPPTLPVPPPPPLPPLPPPPPGSGRKKVFFLLFPEPERGGGGGGARRCVTPPRRHHARPPPRPLHLRRPWRKEPSVLGPKGRRPEGAAAKRRAAGCRARARPAGRPGSGLSRGFCSDGDEAARAGAPGPSGLREKRPGHGLGSPARIRRQPGPARPAGAALRVPSSSRPCPIPSSVASGGDNRGDPSPSRTTSLRRRPGKWNGPAGYKPPSGLPTSTKVNVRRRGEKICLKQLPG
ncbi:formin-like protein 5 [Papio anubis]|uniref:formin-like protein 5 n=1 Tax=Papio anubis TaxID=9555 RepID=UPI0012AD9D87|nr:formin-like protein 5 [Papio anubis]